MVCIKKGLDLPMTGKPDSIVDHTQPTRQVALTGPDFNGMKPTMLVKEGDKVKTGQPLFEDKKVPGVLFTSPATGVVAAVNRGEKRVFQNIVIDVEPDEQFHAFKSFQGKDIADYSSEELRSLLIESGMWASLRTRPFSKSPEIDSDPHAVFVTAMDTNPLGINAELVIDDNRSLFETGVHVLSQLIGDKKVYVCKQKGSGVSVPSMANVEVKEFRGVHPAGNVGTHIHFVDPVSNRKSVWHIGFQDVIAMGSLVVSGRLRTERIIAVGGPQAKNPRHLRVRLGSDIYEMLSGEALPGENRLIAGSVLNGRKVCDRFRYLGYFHNQATLLKEDSVRVFMGWSGPGYDKFSVTRSFISHFMFWKKFALGTSTHGSPRAMVPIGSFEKVMPLDILPTQLLRALVTKDTDSSQALGCLELDEEDLALCTFVSPGKTDFGPALRETLTTIEKEG